MRRTTVLLTCLATGLVLSLLAACDRTPGEGSLILGAAPGGALVTVASDLDGSVAYEGPGNVTLTSLPPGPYVVMTGEGDAMLVQFVTLEARERQRVTLQSLTLARYGSPGTGGHTAATNNLSFPVIWAEGASGLPLPGSFGQPKLTAPYDVDGDGSITEADEIGGYYQFAQKVAGNVWQAQSVPAPGKVYVTDVDWGDSLESIDGKLGRPLRIELTLYKDLSAASEEEGLPDEMLEFPMTMLAAPSSPDEVQGAGASAYPIDLGVTPARGSLDDVHTVLGGEATVYSSGYGLVIQPLVGLRESIADGDLAWNASEWVDADETDPSDIEAPLSAIAFSSELNVGGKVIYGLSQGGWKPRAIGDYRITFYLQPTANARLDTAIIRASSEEATVTAEPTEGGTAHVLTGTDPVTNVARNLTYIDIRIVAGGGARR